MNEATKQTFTNIAGYQPSIFYDFFTWVLLLSLTIMILVVIIRSGQQRRKDPDYHDIDMMIDILRATGIMLILFLIFNAA